MKNQTIFFALLFTVMTSIVKGEQHPREILNQVADAAGLSSFESVESISYTFNAEIGAKEVSRGWTWFPKEDRVIYLPGLSGEVSYLRSDLESDETLAGVDQKFINDLYWLIFPFVAAWDATTTIEVIPEGNFTNNIEAAGGLEVIYPDGVGYTPGDVYEIYYDEDFLVTDWVFRKGGSETPSRITAWENYENFGPLAISLNRTSGTDNFRIFFSDVAVTTP